MPPAIPYSGLSFPYPKATPINVFSEKVLTAFSASIMAFRSASRRERVVLYASTFWRAASMMV